MFQAYTETDQVTFDDRVFPAKARWKDVSRPPTSMASLDPILETDVEDRPHAHLAARAAVQHRGLHRLRRRAHRDQPDRLPAVGGLRRRLELRPPDGALRQRPSSPNPLYGPNRVVWYCSQVVVQSELLGQPRRRRHLPAEPPAYTFKGDLFGDPLIVGCEGLHGHLQTSFDDGTAYLPNFACNSAGALTTNRPSVVVSEDQGLTWTIRQVKDGDVAQLRLRPRGRGRQRRPGLLRLRERDEQPHGRHLDEQGRDLHPLGRPRRAVRDQERHDARGRGRRPGARGRRLLRHADRGPARTRPASRRTSCCPSTRTRGRPSGGWHLYLSMTYDGGSTGAPATSPRTTRCSAAASGGGARATRAASRSARTTSATCSTSSTSRSTRPGASSSAGPTGASGAASRRARPATPT